MTDDPEPQLNGRAPDPNDPNPTQPAMITGIKQGDEQAWCRFYQLYWPLLTGWARALGCPPGLEADVFQEVAVRLLRVLPNFEYDRRKGSFRGFLKTTVRWAVLDLLRQQQGLVLLADGVPGEEDDGSREDPAARVPAPPADDAPEDDKVFLRSLLHQALYEARAEVEPRTADVFEWYRLEGRSAEQVAAALELPVQTVYEAARRFLDEHLTPAFSRLMAQYEDSVAGTAIPHLLRALIADCCRDQAQFTRTLGEDAPPALTDRMERVFRALRRYPPPTGSETCLLVIPGADDAGATWLPLRPGVNAIGRLEGLQLTLAAPNVSGRHAAIFGLGGDWCLRDEGSRNGTFLNGAKLGAPALLRSGDLIRIGPVTLIFSSLD